MDQFINETERTTMLKKVYDHLQDDESREIYAARSLFSLSDNREYMTDIVKKMTISKSLLEGISKHKKQKLLLFGSGTWGRAITAFFPDVAWDYVVDNNRRGVLRENQIVALKYVSDLDDCYIVLAVLFQYREVETQLIETGVKKDNILVLGRIVEECQYFELPYLHFDKDEVFIDAGGFNGDTSLQFSNVVNGSYEKIYVFEPNKKLTDECRKKLSILKNCSVIEKGTWDVACTLRFMEAGEGSHVAENTEQVLKIETISIDEVLKGDKATFIKMDVEGAEMKSLLGAKETICQYKPKLAISVYHRRDDIWEIPMLFLKYNPDYRFYLRVYSFTGNDTVLYAI